MIELYDVISRGIKEGGERIYKKEKRRKRERRKKETTQKQREEKEKNTLTHTKKKKKVGWEYNTRGGEEKVKRRFRSFFNR